MTKLGADIVVRENFSRFKGMKIGLICNVSSMTSDFKDLPTLFHESEELELTCLFGPQHGARGEKQDNMVESHDFVHPTMRIPVYSLYSKTRQPTNTMMENVDALVFDIQDVGARYYTFIYTMAYAMQACKDYGKKFFVLDRPNPIAGTHVEGNILKPDLTSFVGLYPIAVRHGMTVGELAHLFNDAFGIGCELEVVEMQGWHRDQWFDETGLPWVMPSPNMPALETATVYPGMCLLEGTNLSEGRGTTRPFETVGTPFSDTHEVCEMLEAEELPGVLFRPWSFQPTFNKWHKELCHGFFMYVTDRSIFKPYLTGLAVIRSFYQSYTDDFAWKTPPYEYEYTKLPFDILSGNIAIREMIERGDDISTMEESWQDELGEFLTLREKYLIYSES